ETPVANPGGVVDEELQGGGRSNAQEDDRRPVGGDGGAVGAGGKEHPGKVGAPGTDRDHERGLTVGGGDVGVGTASQEALDGGGVPVGQGAEQRGPAVGAGDVDGCALFLGGGDRRGEQRGGAAQNLDALGGGAIGRGRTLEQHPGLADLIGLARGQ